MTNLSSNDSLSPTSSCSYAHLNTMNAPWPESNFPPQAANAIGIQIVPNYQPPTYDTLVNLNPNCSGYFKINTAYGANSANCTTSYSVRNCPGYHH